MVGAFRCEPGGIQSLLSLPREQWEALEADLLRAGFTLADIPGRVSWRAVKSMVKHSGPDSALHRWVTRKQPPRWGYTEYLLADLIDLVALLWWAKTEDGQKNRNRPKPTPRQGVKAPTTDVVLGGKGVPVEDYPALWAAAVARQVEADAAKAAELAALAEQELPSDQ